MPLGEIPITSYFRKVGKGKSNQSIRNTKYKRKKVVSSITESTGVVANALTRTDPEEPGPSKKRPRKNTSCSLSSASSGSLPPADDIFHTKPHKTKKTRSDGIDKTCSVISLDDDSDDGIHIKNSVGLPCSASDSRCIGPMSLNSVKGKGTSNVMLHQREHSTLRLFTKDTLSPTFSKPRLKQVDGTPKRRTCSDVLHGLSSSRPRRDSMSIRDQSDGEHEVVVLSSQVFERQEEHLSIPHFSGEDGVSRMDPDYNGAFTGILGDDFLHRNHAEHPGHHDLDDLQVEIVKSSQTQNILFDYVSPRRHRTSKGFHIPDPLPPLSMSRGSVEMIIRSSQSQSEVDISSHLGLDQQPECISDYSSSVDTGKPSSYREREGSRSEPVRTFSDELFSVPRRNGSFTELFAQDSTLNGSHLGKTTAESNGPPVQEDSETEPDTDDDMLDYCAMKGNPRQEQASASSNAASNSLTESHLSDDGHISLPEVVEEFRAMFGSDESYPPDFPSSLRQ